MTSSVRSQRYTVLWLPLFLACATWGCARKAESQAYTTESQAETTPQPEPAIQAEDARRGGQPSTQRKLVRDAALQLEVDAYEPVRAAIDVQLAAAQGYVEKSTVGHSEGSVSSAELILRIPAPQLDGFLAKCASLGTVLEERSETRDITEQYYDAQARLHNARKLETRLLELVDTRTEGVKDLLEVERELGRVREQIETTAGKLRLYDQQVGFSKLELRIITRSRFAAGESESLDQEVWRTLQSSAVALGRTARALVLLGTVLLPWLPVLLLLGYAYRVLRRLAKSHSAASPASARRQAQSPLQPAVLQVQSSPAAAERAAPESPSDRPGTRQQAKAVEVSNPSDEP